MKHSFWEAFQNTIDRDNFRGEGHYLAQLVGATKEQYVTAFRHAMQVAPALVTNSSEDGAFGAITFDIDGKTVSRDLIDSVLELAFLDEHVCLRDLTVFDIGAGYGRFATRLLDLFPTNEVYCFDAIPVSSELCRRYLDHRQTTRANVVPFDQLLDYKNADLAVNIHSWSECTLDAIQFWIDFIVASGVKWLFVVPHDDRFRAREINGTTPSFLPLIEKHFECVAQRSKYPPGVDGAFPTVYALFEAR